MSEVITSAVNPKIKRLVELQQKSSERRGSGLFVVEGRRELQHCIEAGFIIDSIFVCPDLLGGEAVPDVGAAKVFGVDARIYDKIACRGTTEGIIAEVRCKTAGLSDLTLRANPLIVVLERVEKPGNIGAVLRSADAAGADAVIICDPLTDLYNPNLIRASLGAVFTVQCVCCNSSEAIGFLKGRGVKILTAQLQDSSPYYDCDMKGGTAIVMGTESTGLTDIWRDTADAHICIPMLGRLDSLNVSVSAAILLFESVRQRNG